MRSVDSFTFSDFAKPLEALPTGGRYYIGDQHGSWVDGRYYATRAEAERRILEITESGEEDEGPLPESRLGNRD